MIEEEHKKDEEKSQAQKTKRVVRRPAKALKIDDERQFKEIKDEYKNKYHGYDDK